MRPRLVFALPLFIVVVAVGCGGDSTGAPDDARPAATGSPAPAPAAEPQPGDPAAKGATLAPPNEAFKEFHDQLRQYLELRSRVEKGLPQLTETKDPRKIAERAAMLAKGLQEARKESRQGTIFTPTVTAEFRRILRDDAAARTKTDKANIMAEVPQKPAVVNGLYPTDSAQGPAALASFPPNLLLVLPELPDAVEYRFLGQALVLRDASANIIVDYLPAAAPARSGGGG